MKLPKKRNYYTIGENRKLFRAVSAFSLRLFCSTERSILLLLIAIIYRYIVSTFRKMSPQVGPVIPNHRLHQLSDLWTKQRNELFLSTLLSAFEVRSIQAAKSKNSSCPRIKPCRELRPICQALLASKFGQWELLLGPIYTVRLWRMRQAYDRPTIWLGTIYTRATFSLTKLNMQKFAPGFTERKSSNKRKQIF